MKIENNLFLLILQKKKKGGALLPILLCLVLAAGIFGGGVLAGRAGVKTTGEAVTEGDEGGRGAADTNRPSGAGEAADGAGQQNDTQDTVQNPDEEEFGENYVTSTYLAEMTREKHEGGRSPYGYTYGPAITGLTRSSDIVVPVGFDVDKLDVEYWTEILNLYADPELKYEIGPSKWEYDKENKAIILSPTNYPVGQITFGSLRTDVVRRYEHDDVEFFPKDAGTDWGNLGTMYLASYVDLETGEKLETPQVQIVSFVGELLETPALTCTYTDDGRVQFSWTKVEGAEEYFICRMNYREEYGYDSIMSALAVTKDTEWTSEAPEYGSIILNGLFSNYLVAQEDWYDKTRRESRIAEYGEEPVSVYKTESRSFFYVVAVSGEGTSMMSNPVDILDIQKNIPVTIAWNTWRANGYSVNGYEKVEDVTPYGYVTMADGSTAMKLIDYDTENAMVIEDRYIYTDENGEFLEGRNVKVLKIPYRIEGTPFEEVMEVVDYDESRLEADLKYIEEREAMLRKRAGDIVLNRNVEFEASEKVSTRIRQVDFAVTANSALSEYLAINMLSGVSVIDVSAFPEAADPDILSDSFMEAYYQNPLILGISGYRTNTDGTAVKVVYDDTAEVNEVKQKEIKEKTLQIISLIIRPGMTELEKELAINQYLCDTCEYDDAALENAEQHNYRYVDSEFNDSFTAYGALINGRCVCAGYAGAFKILADAAGLECVVVTGTLEGNLPHAWNKVRIDGEWEILDVTNNDNEFLSNALLNLPDEAGRRTLTEDSEYVLDGCMRNYVANNGRREYYRLNDMYYGYDEIGEKLAELINEEGTALLRTEYGLDDETFSKIAREVYAALEEDEELYGYYWMGVIYLTTKEPD
ncbi:MAG: transglutaminase domain-containing protein [Lachnospiraceae bacterium]|nr:transglutaminase domain-containing protein [Lachnospiraceae bacterium]